MLQQGQSNASCDPVRVAQVEEQTNMLSSVADDLTKIVETIEKRLVTVLRSSPNKMSMESPPVPEELLVPLAGNLRDTWRTVNSAVDRLRALNSAIELPGG